MGESQSHGWWTGSRDCESRPRQLAMIVTLLNQCYISMALYIFETAEHSARYRWQIKLHAAVPTRKIVE